MAWMNELMNEYVSRTYVQTVSALRTSREL